MKKDKFTEFLKGKGYYVLLFVGVLAIAAVAYIGSNISPEPFDEGQNFVDLNDTDIDMAGIDVKKPEADDQTAGDVANNESNINEADTKEQVPVVEDNTTELEELVDSQEGEEVAQQEPIETAEPPVPSREVATNEPVIETTGTSVEANSGAVIGNLSFKAENGLLWPVNGDVVMKYSMDRTIYHATLKTYKVNPAIILRAPVGTEVKAAAQGIITSIANSSETGTTVTTSIGDGYSLVYGQLDNVKYKVGEKINEGEVLGNIAEPSKYYVLEESNLYFQVLKDDETVDPMLYLR